MGKGYGSLLVSAKMLAQFPHSPSITCRQWPTNRGICEGPRYAGSWSLRAKGQLHISLSEGDDLISFPTSSHLHRRIQSSPTWVQTPVRAGSFAF